MPDSIDSPENDYLYIKTSQLPNAGKGLYTSIDIFKDEIIATFKGKRLSNKEAARLAKENKNGYFINMLDGSILDSKDVHCFAKYANDPQGLKRTSFPYNAEISLDDNEQVCLIAIKKIKPEEEIFCNYGKKYWLTFKENNKGKVSS